MMSGISNDTREAVNKFLALRHQLFIGGERIEGSADPIAVIDPATGRKIADVSAASEADIHMAATVAREAFLKEDWLFSPPVVRANMLLKLADLIERDIDILALIETLDNGMPFMVARHILLPHAVQTLRYNAGWATKISGETINPSMPGEWHAYTSRQPLGVAALIVPWNVPLPITLAKLGMAIAAGCSVVIKPAEQTPLSALYLADLIVEAGFPAGIVNIVNGIGTVAGEALVRHKDIAKISFTGSTAVGQRIMSTAALSMKRISLELGGKSPVFIFPDADIEGAIASATMGIFGNSGQICAAGSRLFAHASVFDRVVEGIAAQAEKLTIGAGSDMTTMLGPLVSQRQKERVLGFIEQGRTQGAKIVTGGKAVAREGYFVEPTVIVEAAPDNILTEAEVFGPVLCAVPFEDAGDLAALAALGNDTQYGLAASIWTEDLRQAHGLARRLDAGTIAINATFALDAALPFGGFKMSGLGRENGLEGIHAFTETKSVAVNLSRRA